MHQSLRIDQRIFVGEVSRAAPYQFSYQCRLPRVRAPREKQDSTAPQNGACVDGAQLPHVSKNGVVQHPNEIGYQLDRLTGEDNKVIVRQQLEIVRVTIHPNSDIGFVAVRD